MVRLFLADTDAAMTRRQPRPFRRALGVSSVARRPWAFTLTEVLVTVLIIGILASMAAPQFFKSTERTYWRASRDILRTIYAGEQLYFVSKKVYYDPDVLGDWTTIYVDDPNGGGSGIPVTFDVALSVDQKSFTATATREAGVFMTIDQNGGAPDDTNWPFP